MLQTETSPKDRSAYYDEQALLQEGFCPAQDGFSRSAAVLRTLLLIAQAVLPYLSPSPAAGVQRYVFSLFQQPNGAAIDVSKSHPIMVASCHHGIMLAIMINAEMHIPPSQAWLD